MGSASDIRLAYERYGPALLRKAERILGNPDDAADVVHSLFVDLHARERDARAGELPYLYRAVTNRCLNLVRDTGRRRELLARHGPPQPEPRLDRRAVDADLLHRLVASLDTRSMEVLVCLFIDDMTQEEVAAHLDISRRTVGKRLQRIRRALDALGEQSIERAS